MAEKKYVYAFDEAYGLGKELLGGKGAGLAEMTHIGVPVPEGFTITTEACTLYYDSGKKIPEFVVKQIFAAVEEVEKKTGKKFGGDHNPLLVSVRSGILTRAPERTETKSGLWSPPNFFPVFFSTSAIALKICSLTNSGIFLPLS